MSYHNPSFPGDRLILDFYRKTIVVSIGGGVECDVEQPCLREVEEFVVQILGQSRHVSPSLASLTGKLKEDVSHGESEEDYIEAFGRLDVSENSNNSDRSYSPSIEVKYPPVSCVKPKEKSSQKKAFAVSFVSGLITITWITPSIGAIGCKSMATIRGRSSFLQKCCRSSKSVQYLL